MLKPRNIKVKIALKDTKGVEHLKNIVTEIPVNMSKTIRDRILERAPRMIYLHAIDNIQKGNENSTAVLTGNLEDKTYVEGKITNGGIEIDAGVIGDVPYASIHNKASGTRIRPGSLGYLRFYIARDKPGFNWTGKTEKGPNGETGGHWIYARKKPVLRPKREYLTNAVKQFEDEYPQLVASIAQEIQDDNYDPLFKYTASGLKVYLGGNRSASLHKNAATRLQELINQ